MSDKINSFLWQDRNVKFDVISKELLIKNSEKKLRTFLNVEDTKGNTGDYGRLTLTNLRIIWQSKTKSRINLTIGYNCISSISKKSFHSELRGHYNALHLLCKTDGTKYEFIFTQFNSMFTEPVSLNGEKSDLIYWITHICKAYADSKLFRDLKLRSNFFKSNRELKTLPNERIYDKIQGVWNLSADQGNLGTMHLTDIRILWVANLNELFNLSLPYIQINSIKVRESKFGLALVIESVELSGGYVLGFRIDPPERLQKVYNEITNLYNVHKTKPEYGVERFLQIEQLELLDKNANFGEDNENKEIQAHNNENEFVEELKNINSDNIAAYLTDDQKTKTDNLYYSDDLGLMIESLKDGFSLKDLWHIVNEN